jgi:superfamily II DNA or RNA helicase
MEDLESKYTKLDLYIKIKNKNNIPLNIIEELDNLDIRKLNLIYECVKNKLQSEIKKLCGKYKIDNIINFLLSIDLNKSLYIKFIDFVKDESFINYKDFILLYERIIINHPLIIMMKENNYDINKINKIEEFIDFINNNSDEELEENENQLVEEENILEYTTTNFTFKDYQNLVFDTVIQQNFKQNGIIFQYMGSGKTAEYLHIINMHYNKDKQNNIYIIACERKEILEQLIFYRSEITDEDWNNGIRPISDVIINANNFNIINYPKNKLNIEDVKFDNNQPNILIINNAALRINYIKDNNILISNKHRIKLLIVDECHSSSASGNYRLLKYIKDNFTCTIYGFSATPVRTNKLYDKMAEIYGFKENDELKINYIGTYTIIDSIKARISLPFKYYMAPLSIIKDNENINKIKNIIDKVLPELPYKKIIVWCGSINKTEEYFEKIGHRYKIENEFDVFITHNRVDDKDAIQNFNKKEKNAILFCCNQCREGCNFKNVDAGIYLEGYKTKGIVIRMQSSGRINRRDELNKKKYAIMIEFINDEKKDEIYGIIINQIIELYNYTLKNQTTKLDEIDKVFDFMQFMDKIKIENGQIITDTFIFDNAFIPTINCDNIRTNIINVKLNTIKKEKIKWFEYAIKVIKSIFKFNKNTIFDKKYNGIPDKRGLPPTFNEFFIEFKEFLNVKNLYDYLEIDTSDWINDKQNCKKFIIINNIIINEDIDYYDACNNYNNLPKDPNEFYRLQNFCSIIGEFKERKIDLF